MLPYSKLKIEKIKSSQFESSSRRRNNNGMEPASYREDKLMDEVMAKDE